MVVARERETRVGAAQKKSERARVHGHEEECVSGRTVRWCGEGEGRAARPECAAPHAAGHGRWGNASHLGGERHVVPERQHLAVIALRLHAVVEGVL